MTAGRKREEGHLLLSIIRPEEGRKYGLITLKEEEERRQTQGEHNKSISAMWHLWLLDLAMVPRHEEVHQILFIETAKGNLALWPSLNEFQ